MPVPVRAAVSWALGFGTIVEGVETFFSRGVKVEVLDGAAVGLSLLRGNYFTAGAITTMLALGRYLEGHTEQRTARLLKGLLRPRTGDLWVVRDGGRGPRPGTEVRPEIWLSSAPGNRGRGRVVREGEASVNQSPFRRVSPGPRPAR
jgi:Cu2+-exporting ATPase